MKVQKLIVILAIFSLAIIFDGTGSMQKDLMQLREAAKKVIESLSLQNNCHIVEYVLVVYRDPSE
jgi:hypothetical protein